MTIKTWQERTHENKWQSDTTVYMQAEIDELRAENEQLSAQLVEIGKMEDVERERDLLREQLAALQAPEELPQVPDMDQRDNLSNFEWHSDEVIQAYARQAQAMVKSKLAVPPPPHECKTEAEKTAYAFGWWKALEAGRG